MRKDKRWSLHLLNDVGDGEGLPCSCCSEEDLVMEAISEPLHEFGDGSWLVAGGDEVGAQGEGPPSSWG
jgi:hypothetical protein